MQSVFKGLLWNVEDECWTGSVLFLGQHLKTLIDSGKPLSNDSVEAEAAAVGSEELRTAVAWSNGVNAFVEDIVEGVPPFPLVKESLEKLKGQADLMVVSQTPVGALVREWGEHGIDAYVSLIAGQEMGKKSEHLELATGERYAKEKTAYEKKGKK